MSQGVVDRLEVVEIEIEKSELAVLGTRAGDRPVEQIEEGNAVRQSRQAIVESEPVDLLALLGARGDVVLDGDEVGDLP